MPRSHVQAHMDISANYIAQLRVTRNQIMVRSPGREYRPFDAVIADAEAKLNAPAMLAKM